MGSRENVDVSATSAITTRGRAVFDEFFAMESNAAITTFAWTLLSIMKK